MSKIIKAILIILAMIILVGAGIFLYREHGKSLYKYKVGLEPSDGVNPYPQSMTDSQQYTTKVGDNFRVLATYSGVNTALVSSPDSIFIVGDKSILKGDPYTSDGFQAIKIGEVTIKVTQQLSTKPWPVTSFTINSGPVIDNRSPLKKKWNQITDYFTTVEITDSLTLKVIN